MLEKAKHEQIPLGVDHALSVLQGVAQSLVQLHAKGVAHGTLSPHSVWVSFEGATQLLDAPIAGSLQSLLPKCPVASASLSRYRTVAGTSLLQTDLFSLGAILFELLTLDKLPSPELLSPTLAKATLKAAQEDGPIPHEILGLLKRLLGVDRVFESPSAFSTELERVLYDGDYSPTTFNMAFFMHTLFREENEHDLQAMKADQAADFSPFLEAEPNQRKIFETTGGQSFAKYLVWGGVGVAGLLGFFGWKTWDASKKAEKATQELAMLQRTFAENEAKLVDLNRQEMATKSKSDRKSVV
jgi:serine/threonine protein kinase